MPTRDHTERMLRHFGAEVRVAPAGAAGGKRITVVGWPELKARDIVVPGDPSSAAFAVVPRRLIRRAATCWSRMSASIRLRAGLYRRRCRTWAPTSPSRTSARSAASRWPTCMCKGAALKGVEVPPERAPTMIDEYPILAVAAACAEGTTRMLGLAELRAKESDRLSSVAAGLAPTA